MVHFSHYEIFQCLKKCLTLLTSEKFIPQLPKFNSIVNYKIIFVSVVVNPPVWSSYLMEIIFFNAKI